MKITALVENTASDDFTAAHGLSFYIETKSHKILFDLGPDDTVFENATKLDIDLSKIDTVIISHGHYDHGGALREFFGVNPRAKIYLQSSAFLPHFSGRRFIGIDDTLKTNGQIILLNGDFVIDEELSLITVSQTDKCRCGVNDVFYECEKKDSFTHEQNLIVKEDKTALIMGCGHCGVVNIMDKAREYRPSLCIGGFHLFNPTTGETAPNELLDSIAECLREYKDTEFYTCHCTGTYAYEYLSCRMSNLRYISCGESVEV